MGRAVNTELFSALTKPEYAAVIVGTASPARIPVGEDAVITNGAAITVNVSILSVAGPKVPLPGCDAFSSQTPTVRSVMLTPDAEEFGTVQIEVVRLTIVTGVKP